LGIGDWGLGIGPNPQSPIPNPQSPIPIYFEIEKTFFYFKSNKLNELNKLNNLKIKKWKIDFLYY
jgi:hypothetical protein